MQSKYEFMRLSILADETLKKEVLQKNIPAAVKISWHTRLEELTDASADAYFDLLFEQETVHTNEAARINRIEALKKLLPAPVYINAVTDTLAEIGQPFIRINAWPGFLNRNIIEIVAGAGNSVNNDRTISANSGTHNDNSNIADTTTLDVLGWKYEAVPDQPGMIAPRVVAMIVNEAYFALGEDVSTKAEIDTAMKLGTNYPFGPFEWSEKIGLEKITALLTKLSKTDDRYIPADALLADR